MLTTPEIAKKINKRIADRTESIRSEITHRQKRLTEVEKEVTRLFELTAILDANKFDYRVGYWTETVEMNDLNKEQVVALSKVVGKFQENGRDVADPKKKLICINLISKKYPFLYVSYQMKLPKGGKCKIERSVTKAKTSYALVCNR